MKPLRPHIIKPSLTDISIWNKLMGNVVIIWLFFKFYLETEVEIGYDANDCMLKFTWCRPNITDEYNLIPKSLCYVCDELLLSFKAFIIFMTRFLTHLKPS